MSDQGKKLTITMKKAADFKVYPAEGALGGITPSQMYQINFYIETPNIPSEITHALTRDGKLGAKLSHTIEGGDILRELQCAVLMTVTQAESLANWILTTVKQNKSGTTQENEVVM